MFQRLYYFLFCGLFLANSHAQDSPCHCLNFEVAFHQGTTDLEFVADSMFVNTKGETTVLYKEQTYGKLMAMATVLNSSKKSCPTVKRAQPNTVGSQGLVIHNNWEYDLAKAQKRLKAYAKKKGQIPSTLNKFDFLPAMTSTIQVHIQLFPAYKIQLPLPQEVVTMSVHLTIHAHPFYSDWNTASPFQRRAPRLSSKVAYLEGYSWEVVVKDGVSILQQLKKMPQ